MKRHLVLIGVLALVAALSATAARGEAAKSVAGTISVLGPYSGSDEQSFSAVLAGFKQSNPDVTVNYVSAGENAGGQLANLVALDAGVPDLAVLTLPADAAVLRALATRRALQPISFAAGALDAGYAFAWKRIGLVNGTLYALPFKATNRSAFWYDTALFKRAGVQPPESWHGLQTIANRLLRSGIKPFSIPGADGQALTDLFESVYLGQQGQAGYERLARHEIKWTDHTVKDALKTTRAVLVNPAFTPGGLQGTLETDFPTAVTQVFGARPKAAMVFGGNQVLEALSLLKGTRPMKQFGSFAFPAIGKPPARVIGRADVAVMLKDSPAVRALIQYLATPGAATIWVKRGGFLSPNRKVDLKSYPLDASRALATALTHANAFRLDLSEQQPAAFSAKLGQLMQRFISKPSSLDQITRQLEAAYVSTYRP